MQKQWVNGLLILVWMAIGTGLRFTNLLLKPLWTDEFSTLVFGLGNSFLPVPLDQLITAEQLLAPLRPFPGASVADVTTHLLTESNHPTLYFILTHFWLKLFPTDGYVSVWGARSLSALFGILSVPASFALGRIAFRRTTVGHLSALLMAVSPFGIYLAQEARHYTLAILWIIASLICLLIAARALRDDRPLPNGLVLVWVVINGFAIATHYFFILTLAAQALVLIGLALSHIRQKRSLLKPGWWQLGVVVLGTAASGLVWLPYLLTIRESKLTEWLYQDVSGLNVFNPILKLLAGVSTMLYVLPIQADNEAVVVGSAVLTVLLCVWTVPKVVQGLKLQTIDAETQFSIHILGGFVLAAGLLFLLIAYTLGMDLPGAFRYSFVYFPAVVVLLAAGLAWGWEGNQSNPSKTLYARLVLSHNRVILTAIVLVSLLGGVTVVTNLAYQKTNRPDIVAEAIREESRDRPMIAIAHHTHGQTGRLMGIAWALRDAPTIPDDERRLPYYFLAHEDAGRTALDTLKAQLSKPRRAASFWLVNVPLQPGVSRETLFSEQNCLPRMPLKGTDGYRYQYFHCRRVKP